MCSYQFADKEIEASEVRVGNGEAASEFTQVRFAPELMGWRITLVGLESGLK